MNRRSSAGALAALVFVLSACGAAATPIPAGTAAASSAPSLAASEAASAAAPSTEASAEAPSTEPSTAGSSAGASFAIGSFALPSDAKDLEALLPSTMCGQPATKASVSGANLGQSVDASFLATLQALGKTVNDVSFALAISTSGCTAGIFRIQGVDQTALQTALVAAEQKSGNVVSQASVGGKSVFVSSESSGAAGKQYVYFHGDAVIFAQAPDETKAASILQQLP